MEIAAWPIVGYLQPPPLSKTRTGLQRWLIRAGQIGFQTVRKALALSILRSQLELDRMPMMIMMDDYMMTDDDYD